MKSDIEPYDERTAKRFADVLFRLGVPSFGPATGMDLLEIVQGIDKVLEAGKEKFTPDMVTLIMGYRNRLMDIIVIGTHQQGQVIKDFEKLLKR